MAIILEYKDYADVHEALDMLNEGIFGNMWNSIKDAFKGISGKVDETIVGVEIDKMFDAKTGELSKDILDQINTITDAESTKAAFNYMRGQVKNGWYFQQSLKFMEDGMVTLLDQSTANKVGAEQGAKTTVEKSQAQGTKTPEAEAGEKGASDAMKKRVADFDSVYRKAVDNLKKQVAAKMAELTKKSSSDKMKLLINNRFATCNTVLLLIEYDIKKLRLGLEQLDGLKKEMVTAYKTSLDSAKQLQIAMTQEKAPKMTVEAYNGLDINGFVKEYPAEAALTADETAKEKFVYPYTSPETEGIIITAYDVNAKTVSFQPVDLKTLKPIEGAQDASSNIPFDDFKANLLEGSKGEPPQKQKGGITKPAAPAAPAPAAAETVVPPAGKKTVKPA